MVFKDKFTVGLRCPIQDLVEEILDAYNILMHHFTPSGISKIALFVWEVKSQNVNPGIKVLCAFDEMHTEFRN